MINFSFLPSLEHIAFSKFAIFLCSQTDVLHLIPECHTLQKNKNWYDKVRSKIVEKIDLLPLPNHCYAKLLCTVRQICLEIVNWKIKQRNRDFLYSLLKDRLSMLQWTSFGRIDETKTAEVLIRCSDIPAEKRYHIACFYSLQDHIFHLQKQIIEFPCVANSLQKPTTYLSVVTAFWFYKEDINNIQSLAGDNSSQISFLNLFQCSAYDDNIAGVKYFLKKLTAEEKESVLVDVAKGVAERCILYSLFPDTFPSDTLFFLLSLMSTEQQIEVFQCRSVHILICFLYWPLQDYFFKMLEHLFSFLSDKDIYKLLKLGVMNFNNFKEDVKLYNFPDVFEIIWKKSSESFKKFIVKEFVIPGTLLLYYLVKTRDTNSISLVLDYAATEEGEKINSNVIRVSYPNYFCFCEKINSTKACSHDMLYNHPGDNIRNSAFGFMEPNINVQGN